MGSSKSPRTTSYRSSIETIALNSFVFQKIRIYAFWQQTETEKQMDRPIALSRSRCRQYLPELCSNEKWFSFFDSHSVHTRSSAIAETARSVIAAAQPSANPNHKGKGEGAYSY